MRENKQQIGAVLSEDLKETLEAINVYDQLLEGQLQCACCGDVMNEDNLIAIFPDNKSGYKFVCNKPHCYPLYLEQYRKR